MGSRPTSALIGCLPYPPPAPRRERALARALVPFALCPEFSSLGGSLDPPVSAESGPEYCGEPPGAGGGGINRYREPQKSNFWDRRRKSVGLFLFGWLVLFLNRR